MMYHSISRNLIPKLISLGILAALALVSADRGFGQSRKELERQRQQKEREIALTRKRLAETSKKEKKTVAYLRDLNKLIDERQSLISTLQSQLHEISDHIGEESDIVEALDDDVNNLKQEYAKLLYFMYKNRRSASMLSFVFATSSFNEAIKRIKFIQYYSAFREKQVDLIVKTEESLGSRIADLKSQEEAKKEVLASLDEEKQSLESNKKEQSDLMKELQKDEKKLRRQLAGQQRVARKLDNAIRKIIRQEIAAANKKSRSHNRSTGRINVKKNPAENEELLSTPEMTALSERFAGNRSRLPWPVDKGNIIEHFGTHPHPTLSKCTVNCNGVVIEAAEGAKAKSIFSGTVSAVISIPGANNAVIVNHGSYFTVYSNLNNVFVHKGEKITTRQEIGTVGVDKISGEADIELEIWKAPDQKLDPESWLLQR